MKALEKELSKLTALSKKLQNIIRQAPPPTKDTGKSVVGFTLRHRHDRSKFPFEEKEGASRRLSRILSALKLQMKELARLRLRTTTSAPPTSSRLPQHRGLRVDQLEDSGHSKRKSCKNSNYYRTMKSSPLCSRKLSDVRINISLRFLTPSRMR